MNEQELRQKIAEIEAESRALYEVYEQERRAYEGAQASRYAVQSKQPTPAQRNWRSLFRKKGNPQQA